ncbi:RAP domain-containing protein [Endozoicomonas sp. ALB115]|uniref:RAP domain-containing protein n=1 Tax=Endozoicomonas sp. ALB115 TaxID=3403074 RepID=UPI003BB5EAAE
MHRSSAGTFGLYARPDNHANQPDTHDASSRRVQYRQGTVEWWDNPPRTTPGHNEFYHFSGAYPSLNLLCRSVIPAQNFNALIKQEIMADLVSKTDRYAPFYDGKPHSRYASSIKKYTSAVKRPLHRVEQSQLIHLLQNFTVTRSWNWRSLTTTLHSLTSAGVFTPHNPMEERVQLTQTALLCVLLDGIILKYIEKPEARDIDAQGIANLLWAMAKLVDNGQEQTPGLNEAVVTLLPLVNAQKYQFNAQGIANQLWAMAKLGELIELNLATSTFESLVYRINKYLQFSQEEISMSLWGVMVCCARLSLDSNGNKNNVFKKHMDDLFTRLKNTSPDNQEDQSIMFMAASWLGRACPVVRHYHTNISKTQVDFRDQLRSSIPSLKIEEEKSLNSLPPVDLLLPDHNMVIEVQGPSHYVGGDFKTRKGSTLLKIALLQKAGFEVIEIPTNQLLNNDLMKPCIDQIKIRLGIPPQGHGFVSLKKSVGRCCIRNYRRTFSRANQPGKEEENKQPVIAFLPS